MQTRPFINDSAAALEKKASSAWKDVPELENIAHELSFRSTKPAIALKKKVADRLQELKGNSAPGEDANKIRKELDALKAALGESERQRKQLEKELSETKRQNQRSPNAALYELIGAAENISDIGLKALRTAYRKAHHPDHFPEDEKKAAEKKFKDFENVFDRIASLRGHKF